MVCSRIGVESHVPIPRAGQLGEEKAARRGCRPGWKQEGRTNGRKEISQRGTRTKDK